MVEVHLRKFQGEQNTYSLYYIGMIWQMFVVIDETKIYFSLPITRFKFI